MSMRLRLVLACLSGTFWFGYVTPLLTDRIQRQRSLGVDPISLEDIQEMLDEDTGEVDSALTEMIDTLTGLKLKEGERISAMMALPDQDAITTAKAGLGDLPPPRYQVDHRFFEPLVPELTATIIEAYGYAVEPMGEMSGPATEGERSDQLGVLISLAYHKLLSDEHAAQVLHGAFEMNAIQAERMVLEAALRKAIKERDGEDSGL